VTLTAKAQGRDFLEAWSSEGGDRGARRRYPQEEEGDRGVRGAGAITAGGGAITAPPGDDDLRVFLVVEI